jgi:uncharacterized protein YhfF
MNRANIENFIKNHGLNPQNFRNAWAFCLGNPWENPSDAEHLQDKALCQLADELSALVLSGVKTATASDYDSYAQENLPLPAVDGKFDIVLNSWGAPICAITTTKVYPVSFDKVTAAHAYKEGEGDRSLAHWRKTHETFFRENGNFRPDMLILCEEFSVIS